MWDPPIFHFAFFMTRIISSYVFYVSRKASIDSLYMSVPPSLSLSIKRQRRGGG
jgi:hypothetical protein